MTNTVNGIHPSVISISILKFQEAVRNFHFSNLFFLHDLVAVSQYNNGTRPDLHPVSTGAFASLIALIEKTFILIHHSWVKLAS